MSAITQPTRLRVPRPVLARPFPRRMEQSIFKTIVEMAYEMASCVWRDDVIEQLIPMLRSVKAYADTPKRINGKLPPMRREEGWVREPRYLSAISPSIVARHEYTCLPRSGERMTLRVSVGRQLRGDNTLVYSAHITLHRNLWLNDASHEKLVYGSCRSLATAEQSLYYLPKLDLTLLRP